LRFRTYRRRDQPRHRWPTLSGPRCCEASSTSRATPSYFKGANVLLTIRQLVGDDARWNAILLGLTRTFRHRLVTGAEIEDYIGRASGGRRWLRPTAAWQRLPVPSRTGAELVVDESFYVTSRNLAGSSSQRP
jgi:hypothetical protein